MTGPERDPDHERQMAVVQRIIEHDKELLQRLADGPRPTPPDKSLRLDIDWSDCPLVQRHSGYLGGAWAMVSAPRTPLVGLIVNYNDGYSPEELSSHI